MYLQPGGGGGLLGSARSLQSISIRRLPDEDRGFSVSKFYPFFYVCGANLLTWCCVLRPEKLSAIWKVHVLLVS